MSRTAGRPVAVSNRIRRLFPVVLVREFRTSIRFLLTIFASRGETLRFFSVGTLGFFSLGMLGIFSLCTEPGPEAEAQGTFSPKTTVQRFFPSVAVPREKFFPPTSVVCNFPN